MSEAARPKRRSAAQDRGDLETAAHHDTQAAEPARAATTPTGNTVTVRLADGSSLTFIGSTEALGLV